MEASDRPAHLDMPPPTRSLQRWDSIGGDVPFVGVRPRAKATKRRCLRRETMIERLRGLYETATKMIIEKQVYGSLENFRLEMEKWIAASQAPCLLQTEALPEYKAYEAEISGSKGKEPSSDDEDILNEARCPPNSESEEEEHIYEEMNQDPRLPLKSKADGKEEIVYVPLYSGEEKAAYLPMHSSTPQRKNEKAVQTRRKADTTDSGGGFSCVCVNIGCPEGEETDEEEEEISKIF